MRIEYILDGKTIRIRSEVGEGVLTRFVVEQPESPEQESIEPQEAQ